MEGFAIGSGVVGWLRYFMKEERIASVSRSFGIGVIALKPIVELNWRRFEAKMPHRGRM